MQQMKEHGKNPQDQTNEEEMGSLPGQEFIVMTFNMIQNLRNKIEAQMKWMKAQIEKIPEMFRKDLEKLKNRQPAMNNTITEIKNTPEGPNGITEAEKWISELEDRMVATKARQNKQWKEMKTVLETFETTLSTPIFELWESQKKRKRKDLRKYLRRL